jgi:hypothetical protein
MNRETSHGTSSGTTRVARIQLPDGTPVWARVSAAEELDVPSGELSFTDTGFAERVEASVESLHSLITGVARSLSGPLRAVRPDEVSVEFGIELTAKAGKVVGLLADGEAKAAITVTLTWNGDGPPDPAGPGATVARPGTLADPTGPTDTASPSGPAAPRPRDGEHPAPPATAPAPVTSHPGPVPTPRAVPRTDASTGAPVHGGAPGDGAGGEA